MTDTPDRGHPTEDDLRPIISTLQEIRTRCRSLGNRSEEFPEMARHVDRLLAQLASGRDARGLPVDYRDIARQLFPVAHLFESVGFLTEGRQIAELEKQLTALVPDDAPPLPPAPPPTVGPLRGPARDGPVHATDEAGEVAAGRRLAPTRPILGAALLALVVIIVCVWVILRHDPAARLPDPTPTPTATPSPTPKPTPTPIVESAAERIERSRRERLLEAVSAARRELVAGNVDGAVSHLNEAAAIDATPGVVVETASEAVDRLLDLARAAAEATQWDAAQLRLDQARALARRFNIDDDRVRQTASSISNSPRFRRYLPSEWRPLDAEAGRRAVVELIDGSSIDGIVKTADAARLVIVRRDEVGSTGGVINYEDDIPMDRVREVRVYDR